MMRRVLGVTAAVLLSLNVLGSLLSGNVGAFLLSALVLAVFLVLTNTFGARSWIFRRLKRNRDEGMIAGTDGAPSPPQSSGAPVQQNKRKAELSALAMCDATALDNLPDADVRDLLAAFRRLRLERGGGLLPRAHEAVIGCKREVWRYEWKGRTIRQGGGGGWGFSTRVMSGVYLHQYFRSPTKSVQVRELTPVDNGTLYLTTDRLYFDGERNISIWYDKLDSLPQWSKDGFLVLQHGEKDVLIKVGKGQDAMAWAMAAGFLVTRRRA